MSRRARPDLTATAGSAAAAGSGSASRHGAAAADRPVCVVGPPLPATGRQRLWAWLAAAVQGLWLAALAWFAVRG